MAILKPVAVVTQTNNAIFVFHSFGQMSNIVTIMTVKRKAGGMLISMVRTSVDICICSEKKRIVIFYLDKWIARQMEITPDQKATLLVAG